MPGKQIFFQQEHKWLLFFIGLAVLVNFSGLFIPVMDPDAAVYASLSKNMVLRNNWLELFFQGKDWLDKPHFPFWVTAVFFELFGFHTWCYKLPAILFVLLGARYTYLFTRQYYNTTVALWAVFILLTAEHLILSNNDVRAEPYLTGLIIAAIYHFSNALNKKAGWHLTAACFFAACAVMTKGPFTLIPVGAAIAGELIIRKNWKEFFHWKWLIAAIMIAIFITPELYCLWYQFDQHPEKTVLGQTGVSGIRFFLWDSQFGRFMNTGPIKGGGDPLFFLHTLLWAFLPWSLLLYTAIVVKIRTGLKKINETEWFSLCGSIITILIFSLSRFQLPYYTNIIFPLMAILTARYIEQIQLTRAPILKTIQNCITILLAGAGIFLYIFYGPPTPSILLLLIIIAIVLLLIGLPLWLKVNSRLLAFFRVGLASLALNLFLNRIIYPDLLKYQSGSEAALYMNKNYPGVPGVRLTIYAPAFEFYLKDSLIKADTGTIALPGPARTGIWYVSEEELSFLTTMGYKIEVIKEFPDFHVTTLTMKFLNNKTRNSQLKKCFLVRIL